jgi:hypothetical protein
MLPFPAGEEVYPLAAVSASKNKVSGLCRSWQTNFQPREQLLQSRKRTRTTDDVVLSL